MFAVWITFSGYEDASGETTAQPQVSMRANSPVYEMGLRFGGHTKEDKCWAETLGNLAASFGYEGQVDTQTRRI